MGLGTSSSLWLIHGWLWLVFGNLLRSGGVVAGVPTCGPRAFFCSLGTEWGTPITFRNQDKVSARWVLLALACLVLFFVSRLSCLFLD